MKQRLFATILIACLSVGLSPPANADPMTSPSFRITRTVISSGGAATSSGSFQLSGTLSQPSPLIDSADPPQAPDYELLSGFWYILFSLADSDNDGLSDLLEAGGCTDPFDADTDDDGILDGDEDADHDGSLGAGETDPCLADTDGDGLQDGTEMGLTSGDVGPDTDAGVFIPDADPATTTDPLDTDTDNDGMSDGEEDANHNGAVDDGETDPNVFDPSNALPWILLLLLQDE